MIVYYIYIFFSLLTYACGESNRLIAIEQQIGIRVVLALVLVSVSVLVSVPVPVSVSVSVLVLVKMTALSKVSTAEMRFG